MKPDPTIVQALKRAEIAYLPTDFAKQMEQMAYAVAHRARPSVWIERGVALFAGVLMALAVLFLRWFDPELFAGWETWQATLSPKIGSVYAGGVGGPALAIVAFVWLLSYSNRWNQGELK